MCHILSRVRRGRRRVTSLLLLLLIFVRSFVSQTGLNGQFLHISNDDNNVYVIENDISNYYTFTHIPIITVCAMKYKICGTTAAAILYYQLNYKLSRINNFLSSRQRATELQHWSKNKIHMALACLTYRYRHYSLYYLRTIRIY